jgi:hypothetical protein
MQDEWLLYLSMHSFPTGRILAWIQKGTYMLWKDGQLVYAIGAVRDIRRSLAYDSQMGEKRSWRSPCI